VKGQTDQESEGERFDDEKEPGEEKDDDQDPADEEDPLLKFGHVGRSRLHPFGNLKSNFPKNKEENADQIAFLALGEGHLVFTSSIIATYNTSSLRGSGPGCG
jgi:hypothetical protein